MVEAADDTNVPDEQQQQLPDEQSPGSIDDDAAFFARFQAALDGKGKFNAYMGHIESLDTPNGLTNIKYVLTPLSLAVP
jgi:hypothetical protein